MNLYDEATKLRIRESALTEDSVRWLSDQVGGSPSMVARTVSLGSYPTSPSRYYACIPITVLGSEVQGGSGVLTAEPGTFFALNLGSTDSPPPARTYSSPSWAIDGPFDMMDDELHRLRVRQSQLSLDIPRRRSLSSTPQLPAFVGRVTADSSALTTPSKFYSVNVVTLLGTEEREPCFAFRE